MRRKIIALVAVGGIAFGLYSWFDNWFYSGSGAGGPSPVRCDTCHVQRRATAVGGTRKPDPTSRAKRPYVLMEVTAYSYTGSRTASGKWPRRGMVAADKSIPFGTVLYIEGYGRAVVEDRGGLIRAVGPNRNDRYADLDVFVTSELEAKKWGRRVVKVYVYE
jgi:3D (Asp-Asp-Asp) domain-containing protein